MTSLYRKNPHVQIQNNQVQLYRVYIFYTFVGNKKNKTHISNTIEQLLSLLPDMQGNNISEFKITRYSRILEI